MELLILGAMLGLAIGGLVNVAYAFLVGKVLREIVAWMKLQERQNLRLMSYYAESREDWKTVAMVDQRLAELDDLEL